MRKYLDEESTLVESHELGSLGVERDTWGGESIGVGGALRWEALGGDSTGVGIAWVGDSTEVGIG